MDPREKKSPVTPAQAKKIIKAALEERSLPFEKLTARTISFGGFGYGSSIFVTIHGWSPNPAWNDLKSIAHDNGFCIESGGGDVFFA